jgi:hypothetical protein
MEEFLSSANFPSRGESALDDILDDDFIIFLNLLSSQHQPSDFIAQHYGESEPPLIWSNQQHPLRPSADRSGTYTLSFRHLKEPRSSAYRNWTTTDTYTPRAVLNEVKVFTSTVQPST